MRKSEALPAPVRLERTFGSEVCANASDSTSSTATSTSDAAYVPSIHAAAAVEATLDAVERVRDVTHSSVELKLSFGDDRLDVRVELRGDTVQTTFRTDSADLRDALANAWHQQAPSVAENTSDRPVRIADPVFSSGSGSTGSGGTSTGGQAGARQQSATPLGESFRSPGPRTPAPASSEATAADRSRQPSTSVLLNAFA